MESDRDRINRLAEAVASGQSVDWAAAEELADTADVRNIVHQLGILAVLSAVHQKPTDSDDNAKANRWGRFDLLAQIGRGTSGTVFQSWDPLLERPIALKLFHAMLSDSRTLGEARLLARVRHPNVVTVYGADRVDGRVGIWMERLNGSTLKEEVERRGRLSLRDALLIGIEVCRGVAAVHAAGLVHGDIKAQNVMREPDGRIVLMDFGAGANHDRTANIAAPAVIGTPHYMAPELLDGAPPSTRTDIYSIGVLLYHLLTGRFAIDAASVEELRDAHHRGLMTPILRLEPAVRAPVAAVVDRALAARPDARFTSVAELQSALQRVLPCTDEATSQRMTRRHTSAFAAAAVAAALASVWMWSRAYPASDGTIRSIAVLPFDNLSRNTDEGYLADGLTDMLTSDLAQLAALRVTSRTSAMRYRNLHEDSSSIGRALRVDALVEGTFTHADGIVRVTATVIRAGTDEHLWSQTFERKDTDLFGLQATIASAIARAIKLAITPAEHQRIANPRFVKPEAQDAYLRGRYLMDQFTANSDKEACGLFQKAIDLDRSYARAYASLARCYVLLDFFGVMPRWSAYAAAYDAARRAVEIDDTLSDAHGELADILLYDRWDWQAAAEAYQRSIALNGTNTLTRSHYSRFLSAVGRHDDALAQARLTIEGDPFSAEALNSEPIAFYYAGRFNEAIRGFQETLRLFPNSAEARFGLGRALAASGDYVGAERAIREAMTLTESTLYYRVELARTLIVAGRRREADDLLRTIQEIEGRTISHQYLAYVYAASGERDAAFDELNRAVGDRSPGLLWAKVDPRLAPLRGDSRFLLFLQTLGVPD